MGGTAYRRHKINLSYNFKDMFIFLFERDSISQSINTAKCLGAVEDVDRKFNGFGVSEKDSTYFVYQFDRKIVINAKLKT